MSDLQRKSKTSMTLFVLTAGLGFVTMGYGIATGFKSDDYPWFGYGVFLGFLLIMVSEIAFAEGKRRP